jgi:methionyl-tRNA synthetase
MSKNILVAVAWPYASGSRHLGHIGGAYLPADIFARYNRMIGNNVIMVSGSDVHGTPITVRADNEGVEPIEIVNKYHSEFLDYWKKLNIQWDNYTTTMTENHIDVSQEMFLKIKENGYIEKNKSIQAYDAKENKFLPDRYVEGECPKCNYQEARGDQCDSCGITLDPEELINPKSKISGNNAEFKETEHYFLKLSKLNEKLGNWLKSRQGWRPHVINFSKSFVEEGLQDRAITRDLDWGIDIPENELGEGKKIYVWFEAVIGYLSASKEWAINNGTPDAWKDFWLDEKAESYYFVGKDNVPFHAIIWPAMLLAYGDLNLPTNVPANQYILIKGEKASASRGVGKTLNDYLEEWNPDSLRYSLASILPEQNDSEISEDEMIRRNNEELVAAWGNLVQRVFSQYIKNFDTLDFEFELEEVDKKLMEEAEACFDYTGSLIEKVELKASLQSIMAYVNKINAYLNQTEPWKVIKEDKKRATAILYTAITCIDASATMFTPFMPTSSEKVLQAIQKDTDNNWSLNKIKKGAQIENIGHLFKKID